MSVTKVEMRCYRCGGTDVLKDAFAVWDVETQSWDLHSTYDHAVCNTCDGETKLEEHPVE